MVGEKRSRTQLATPGAAATPFTFTHGKRGTEHLSEKCDGLAGELTVRSSRLARVAPLQGQSVVATRRSRGGSARGEGKGMVLLGAGVEWREPRRCIAVPPRSPPNSGWRMRCAHRFGLESCCGAGKFTYHSKSNFRPNQPVAIVIQQLEI